MTRVVLLASLALALFAGCGSETTGQPPAPAAAGAFPATIKHKFGETTITSQPKRIVVVGLREQDSLLALGIVPVGTTEWYGEHEGAIFPWAKAALGGGKLPTKLSFTDGIQYEKVAALAPDLILAIYSGLNQKDYDTLSKIAPVVAQPPGQVDWGSSWQDEITITGKAVGKPEEAEALKAKAEQQLAAAAAAHPEFKGQTAVVASPYQGIYVYGPQDARSRLMTDLGFSFPKDLENIGGKEFGGQLSDEKVDLLDVGALVWFAEPGPEAKLKKNAVYSKLDVRKQGRDVFIPEQGTLYEATSFISVLSIPLLVDELVPKLAAAADGDPATPTA
jgi:iron-siderophore transport system substrate-binding protein